MDSDTRYLVSVITNMVKEVDAISNDPGYNWVKKDRQRETTPQFQSATREYGGTTLRADITFPTQSSTD
jgi:hypothetical protein